MTEQKSAAPSRLPKSRLNGRAMVLVAGALVVAVIVVALLGKRVDPAGWSAIAAWVTVLIYGALLAYAVQQVREAQNLRRAQVRPFVVVDIPPGFLLYITVENIGNTLARDVSFEFPVVLESTLDRPWEVEEAPLLRDGLKVLPPRKRYRILFDSFISRAAPGCALPMTYDVIVRYRGDDGTSYEETYVLDLNSIMNASPDEKGIPELVQAVEAVKAELAKWTDGGSGPLLVHGRDKDRFDAERQAAAMLLREKMRARAEASRDPAPAPPDGEAHREGSGAATEDPT